MRITCNVISLIHFMSLVSHASRPSHRVFSRTATAAMPVGAVTNVERAGRASRIALSNKDLPVPATPEIRTDSPLRTAFRACCCSGDNVTFNGLEEDEEEEDEDEDEDEDE